MFFQSKALKFKSRLDQHVVFLIKTLYLHLLLWIQLSDEYLFSFEHSWSMSSSEK